MQRKSFSLKEAEQIAAQLGPAIDEEIRLKYSYEQFRTGLNVELEHGTVDPETDVTGDDPILTAKIALAHLREISDYYPRLLKMEQEAEATSDIRF